jgi:hypothetical protein
MSIHAASWSHMVKHRTERQPTDEGEHDRTHETAEPETEPTAKDLHQQAE